MTLFNILSLIINYYHVVNNNNRKCEAMTTDQQLEQNKKNVMAFYDLMFNQNNPAEAIKRYVGDVYIQHNPAVADGKTLSLSILRGWQKNIQESVSTSSV
jgi:hypothetical protein